MMAGWRYVEKHYDAGKERLGKEGIGLERQRNIRTGALMYNDMRRV
jgi:hypothetical protein